MMSPEEITRLLLTIFASVGGSGLIIMGISGWLGKIWADLIYIRTSAKFDRELEELRNRYLLELENFRSEIAERRDFLQSSQSLLSGGYLASHARIVTAVEELWKSVRQIREATTIYHFIYDLYTVDQLKAMSAESLKNLIPNITNQDYHQRITPILQGLEDARLFVGEKLWTLHQVYVAFALQIAWKVKKGVRKGKLYDWDEDEDIPDEYLVNLLHNAFSAEELKRTINQDTPHGAPARILANIEFKMLNEINAIIFGRRMTDTSLEQQQKLIAMYESIASKKVDRETKMPTVGS